MKRKTKNIIIISAIALSLILIFQLAMDYMDAIGNSKPSSRPLHSTSSLEEAKKENVFIAEYQAERRIHPSANGNDSYMIGQIWVERNRNYSKSYPKTRQSENILSVRFNSLTKKNLHKFRLLGNDKSNFEISTQCKYPDVSQHILFLISNPPDTLFLEVIERNPKDSSAWLTQTVIDTLYFIK